MTLSHRAVNNMTMLTPHLLHALHNLQQHYRYIPEDQITPLAQALNLPIEAVEKPSEPPFCGIIRHRKHQNE